MNESMNEEFFFKSIHEVFFILEENNCLFKNKYFFTFPDWIPLKFDSRRSDELKCGLDTVIFLCFSDTVSIINN
jgi:hypothetical protein